MATREHQARWRQTRERNGFLPIPGCFMGRATVLDFRAEALRRGMTRADLEREAIERLLYGRPLVEAERAGKKGSAPDSARAIVSESRSEGSPARTSRLFQERA